MGRVQGGADAKDGNKGTGAQFIRHAQIGQQLGAHLGSALLVNAGHADGERVGTGARSHAPERAGDQADAIGHLNQQRLIFTRPQHGADLGIVFEADEKKGAAPGRALRLAQPGTHATMQLLLAKEAGQFIPRQATAQRALPAEEQQTDRCKCARERQAQCEQVTLTHGAPYPYAPGVAARPRARGL